VGIFVFPPFFHILSLPSKPLVTQTKLFFSILVLMSAAAPRFVAFFIPSLFHSHGFCGIFVYRSFSPPSKGFSPIFLSSIPILVLSYFTSFFWMTFTLCPFFSFFASLGSFQVFVFFFPPGLLFDLLRVRGHLSPLFTEFS